MKSFKYISIFVFLTFACGNDDEITVDDSILSMYVLDRSIEKGAVITCAGSDLDTDNVLVFYYPENGSTDVKLYETIDASVDKNDFSEYAKVEVEELPVFNGYMQKFNRNLTTEKWIIVTYELDGEIKVSNPIRTKQTMKPSVWTDEVTIDQETTTMPIFTWKNNALGDNAIYFQVITDAQDNLLSGTYTLENQFQYYNISNVVLNITTETPPILETGVTYKFTLMDVSEDNWVNLFIFNKSFVAQ